MAWRAVVRAMLRGVATGAVAACAAVLAVHWLGWQRGSLVPLLAFTPYFVPVAALACVTLALVRAARPAVLGLAVCLGLASTQAPLFAAAEPIPGPSVSLSIMTSNLYGAGADAAAVVELVRRHDVDVLLLQQLIPAKVEQFQAAGLEDLLPYMVSLVPAGSSGAGIYSRHPLRDAGRWPGFASEQVQGRLDLPGPGADPLVVSVHPSRVRLVSNARWATDQLSLRNRLAGLSGPVIVGGDFNSSYDHAAFRRYLDDGYVDAAEGSGAGLLATWPVDHPLIPAPFVGIDHVLTRGGPMPMSARTAVVPGSDHRAVVARIAVPR